MSVQFAPAVLAAAPAPAQPAKSAPVETAKKPGGKPYAAPKTKQPPTEVVGWRTSDTDVYDNHDGTYSAQVHPEPINYKGSDGSWQPIDLSFAPMTGKNGRVRVSKVDAPVEVGAADDASGFASVDTGHGIISLRLVPGAKPGKSGQKPTTSKGVAKLTGLMAGVDLQITASPVGFSGFLVLSTRPANSSFSFVVDSPGLTSSVGANGSVAFIDSAGATIATMPAPYAVDSASTKSGGGNFTTDVEYSISRQGGHQILTLTVDETYLAAATYPVYVDPTVTVNVQSQINDSFVSAKYPTYNFNTTTSGGSPNYHEDLVGMDPTYNDQICYTFIKYSMPTGLSGVTVNSAYLSVYPWHQYYSSGSTRTWIDKVLVNWYAGSITWNNMPTGSDLVNVGYADLIEGQTGNFNVTQTIQEWANGTNFAGFRLHENGNGYTYWKRLIASEQGSNMPILTITYNLPVATPESPASSNWTNSRTLTWHYFDQSGLTQTGYEIEVDNNSDFSSPFVNTGWVSGSGTTGTTYSIPGGTALTNGATYYWRVAAKAGTDLGMWSATATFKWDATPPTWVGFKHPSVQADVFDTSYTFDWDPATDAAGIDHYEYVIQYTAVASPNTCGASWTDMSGGHHTTTATSVTQSGLANSTCYRIEVEAVDNAANPSSSFAYSGAVLIDTTPPSGLRPSVTSNCGAVDSCRQASNTIYFRPGAGATVTLTASATDNISGIASFSFGSLSSMTGWTYTSGAVTGNPATKSLTWSANSTSATTLTITATNRAGVPSDPTTVTFIPDSHVYGGFTTPSSPGTTLQSATSYAANWTYDDNGQSGVVSILVQRKRGAVATAGSCAGVSWSNDGNAITSGNTSSVSGLLTGYCYQWLLTVTDAVGNQQTFSSGFVLVDTTNADSLRPDVTATGTGVYQSGGQNGTVYYTNSGSIVLNASVPTTPPSGVANITFGNLAPASGWTPDPALPNVDTTSPYQTTLGYGTTTGSATIGVTATDGAGTTSTTRTVTLAPDRDDPTSDFTAPNEVTLTQITTGTYTVAWQESDATSGPASRTLQRQRALIVAPGSCSGVSWANDGTPTTGASPLDVSGLLSGYCYRWVLTVTDNVGRTSQETSGAVLVDTQLPDASIEYPENGRAFSGTVNVTGIASDVDFVTCVLDYGVGTSPATWTAINSSCSPSATSETLGTWAPGASTGVFTLRLTVTDTLGQQAEVRHSVYLANVDRGSESYYGSVPFDLGGGFSLDVNVATGEATVSRALFSIPSWGPQQSLAIAYNSADDSSIGRLGTGWSSNLTQHLTIESGFVVWHRADGALVPFGQIGTTWTALAGHYETLSVISGGYQITSTDGSSLRFGNDGALVSVVDRYGVALSLNWSAAAGQATATDAGGHATTLALNPNGSIASATDSADREWSFGYESGKLVSLTDPEDHVTTLAYDTADRLASITRDRTPSGATTPTSVVWDITYDSSGRVSHVVDPIGGTTHQATFTYGSGFAAGTVRVSRPRDASGVTPDAVTDYIFDADAADGQLARGWIGTVIRYASAADAANGLGPTTNYTYDDNGNILEQTSLIDATTSPVTNAVTKWTYESWGGVETVESPTGIVTTNEYWPGDKHDLQSTTATGNDLQKPLSTVKAYAYDSAHRLCLEVANPTVSPSTLTCDSQLIQDGPSDTNVVTLYGYDTRNEMASQTNPLGTITAYGYDNWGNQTSATRNYVSGHGADDQTNITITYTYSAAGNVLTETTPLELPSGAIALRTYTYNGLGDGTSETAAGDSTTAAVRTITTWDEFGAKISESQQVCEGSSSNCTWTEQQKSTTTYDSLGSVLSQTSTTPATATTDAIVLTTTFVPDLAGDVLSTTDSDGSTTASAFDGLGQLVSQSGGGAVTSHAYDGLGRTTQVKELRDSQPSVTTTNRYDADGNLSEKTVLDAVDNSTAKTTYTRDGLGREMSVTDPAENVTTKAYDRLGQATKSTVGGSDTDVTYDRAGNVVEISGPYDPALPDAPRATRTRAYDRLGRLTSEVFNGATTTTYYDAADRVIASVDAQGSVSRTVYNIRSQITKTIDHCVDSPQSTPPTCAATGGSADGANVVTVNTYGADGASMVTQKFEAGVETDSTLDGSGRTLSTVVDVGGLALTTTYGYDSKGRQSSVTDPAGYVTRTVYDANGNVCRTISNAATLSLASLTDPCTSQIVSKTGIVNLDTRFAYDNAGNKTDETAPDGGLTHFTYDGEGNLLTEVVNYVPDPSVSDRTANATTTHVLADGREIGLIDPALVRTATVYDDDGNVCRTIENSTIDPSTLTHPCADPIVGATNYANVDTIYSYDPSGQRTRVVAPSPADDGTNPSSKVVTLYAYDLNERLCRVIENADPALDLATLTDLAGASDACYGSLSTAEPARVSTTASNVDTQYHYDDAGNLTSQVSVGAPSEGALSGTTQYGYDDFGHQTSQTDPDGHVTIWTYTTHGDRATQTDPDGQQTYWFYDAAGRMCRRVAFATTGVRSFPTSPCSSTQPVPDAAVDTLYSFDADGNQTRARNALTGEWINASYDALSRPAEVTHSGGVATDLGTSYNYSVLGAVSRRDPASDHGNTLDYSFTLDTAGRQVGLADPLHRTGAAYGWTYGATGAVAAMSDPTGNTTTFGHDYLGRLTGIGTTGTDNGCVACSAYSYSHNAAGNAVGITSTVSGDTDNGTVTYSYDQLSRLLSYSPNAPARHQTYAWNALPDRTSITVGSGGEAVTKTVSYDEASRPASDLAHSSDGNGRVTKTPGQSPNEVLTLSYDPLGRLTKVSSSAGAKTCYAYDPLDRLESVTTGTTDACSDTPTTTFSYVGLTNALALDQTGSTIRRHVTDLDGTELYVYVSDTSPTYLGRNGHGDVTWSYDASGAPTGHATFDPFGNALGSATVPEGTRWQGSWSDTNTGLYYVIARWYDPLSGRFLSEDPLHGDTAIPQSRDPYPYGDGDAINHEDPTGECNSDHQNCPVVLDTSVVGLFHEPWEGSGKDPYLGAICGAGALRVVLAFSAGDLPEFPRAYLGSSLEILNHKWPTPKAGYKDLVNGVYDHPDKNADDIYGQGYMLYLAFAVAAPNLTTGRGLFGMVKGVIGAQPGDAEAVANWEAAGERSGASKRLFKATFLDRPSKDRNAFKSSVVQSIGTFGVPVWVATRTASLASNGGLPSWFVGSGHSNIPGHASWSYHSLSWKYDKKLRKNVFIDSGHAIAIVGYDSTSYYYVDTCAQGQWTIPGAPSMEHLNCRSGPRDDAYQSSKYNTYHGTPYAHVWKVPQDTLASLMQEWRGGGAYLNYVGPYGHPAW
jgi:RHS repeat-associated protein